MDNGLMDNGLMDKGLMDNGQWTEGQWTMDSRTKAISFDGEKCGLLLISSN
jgi:hypothetical protein